MHLCSISSVLNLLLAEVQNKDRHFGWCLLQLLRLVSWVINVGFIFSQDYQGVLQLFILFLLYFMALLQLHYLFILELHNDTFLLYRLCNDEG